MTKTQPPVKVILLREVGNEPISSGDTSELEALKEDLSLVMMDLDAVQQDNKDLVMDIERLGLLILLCKSPKFWTIVGNIIHIKT